MAPPHRADGWNQLSVRGAERRAALSAGVIETHPYSKMPHAKSAKDARTFPFASFADLA